MASQHSNLPDEHLLHLLETNDPQALRFIFQQYHAFLCATAYRIVQDQDVAKDLVQDVFIRLWQHRTPLQIIFSLKAYMHKSVINAALTYLEKEQKLKRLSLEAADEIGEEDGWHASVHAQDLQTALGQAIDQLPPACRTVFVLSRFEELSHAQIADSLHISVKAVEKHITKALKRLRTVVG